MKTPKEFQKRHFLVVKLRSVFLEKEEKGEKDNGEKEREEKRKRGREKD